MYCSVLNKESKSLPPTQQGDFQPHIALKSDSKRKTQRLGKDKGVISLTISTILFFESECKFTVFVVSARHFSSQRHCFLSSASVEKNMDLY